jgi:acetylornithine deacetylase/succinyl-diaminopimelate desuccinylase-like protein
MRAGVTRLDRAALARFADDHRWAFEAELRQLVEIPSVSADPAHVFDVRRCGEAAVAILEAHGARAELLQTPGAPMVLGSFGEAPDRPTITVYNHLDVQPANEPEWRSEPFRMSIEGGTYRGRGTTDDKGPALTAMWGAHLAHDAGVPANLRVLWELEEEIGSPNFRAGLERHRARLATDSIVVSDTVWLTRGKPSTPTGLRGMQSFSIFLETADHDLHSGLVGGAARNPLSELATLVGRMMDGRTGEILIPGFADAALPLSAHEAAEFARSGFSTQTFKHDHQLHTLRTDDPSEVMARVWARPTLEVHGLVGGYVGPGIKSAVPARAELKMSCRMVPRMRGAEVIAKVEAFARALIPDVRVVPEGRLEAYEGLSSGPLADAIREAYQFGFGAAPAFTREGASIGAVPTMAEVLGAPVTFLGLSLPEHGYHAPNESYDWAQASGGMAAFARYFEVVSALPRR